MKLTHNTQVFIINSILKRQKYANKQKNFQVLSFYNLKINFLLKTSDLFL